MHTESHNQVPAYLPQLHRLPTAHQLDREADHQLALGRIVAAERLAALAEAAREAGR